jgi:hypothetical protein
MNIHFNRSPASFANFNDNPQKLDNKLPVAAIDPSVAFPDKSCSSKAKDGG